MVPMTASMNLAFQYQIYKIIKKNGQKHSQIKNTKHQGYSVILIVTPRAKFLLYYYCIGNNND